jgi:hypothetical protein
MHCLPRPAHRVKMFAQDSIPALVPSGPAEVSPAIRASVGRTGEREPLSQLGQPLDLQTLRTALVASITAVLLIAVSTANIQFSTGDEGWLWYGLQRTLAREWPLRDFNSYDPGRYLFLSAWAHLWHSDGIVVMRYGLALVQWLGLFPALLLIARAAGYRLNVFAMTSIAFALALWMVPRHKVFDIDATIWMACALAVLIKRPTRWRYRKAGLLAGLFWLIGRNHLLYGLLSVLLACIWIGFKSRPFRGWHPLRWAAEGFVVGLVPMIVLLLAVKDYAIAYWNNAIIRLVEIGSTNLPLPVPWPWRAFPSWSTLKSAEQAAVGSGFVLLAGLGLLTLCGCIARKKRAPSATDAIVIAAAITSVAWAHQGFSRADLPHLAQASLPMGILLLIIPLQVVKKLRPLVGLICYGLFLAITFLAMLQLNPAAQAFLQPNEPFHWQDINGESLYTPDSTAGDYHLAQEIVKRAGPHPSILFAPYVPGLYAAFRLRCPVFDAYPLYAKTAEEQQQSIRMLKRSQTTWAAIWPYRMDGRPDLGFDKTDADVWHHIAKTYRLEKQNLPACDASVFHLNQPQSADR